MSDVNDFDDVATSNSFVVVRGRCVPHEPEDRHCDPMTHQERFPGGPEVRLTMELPLCEHRGAGTRLGAPEQPSDTDDLATTHVSGATTPDHSLTSLPVQGAPSDSDSDSHQA